MKILIVGNGGREHALAWKVAQSKHVRAVFCAPGNAGTAQHGTNIAIEVSDIEALADFAEQEGIALTIVGPEDPLSRGIVDLFEARKLKIFGPTAAAARLESSKSFAKEIMLAAGVQTARGAVFESLSEAREYIECVGAPIVVKADGLAAGKGVVVAATKTEALDALEEFLGKQTLGAAGARVVIEECLSGREASVIAVVDGETVRPFVVSQDYKRIFDGQTGPNTGGMGAISPTPVLSESRLSELVESVFLPTVRELANRGVRYRGFLYAGVMVDSSGKAHVLEFNCRLGDPETQVLMARMESDLVELLNHAVDGSLAEAKLSFRDDAAVCVVLTSRGYPGKVDDGKPIQGIPPITGDAVVFHAGTRLQGDSVVSKGGRILGVTALGKNVTAAAQNAYALVRKISFDGMHHRSDIGS